MLHNNLNGSIFVSIKVLDYFFIIQYPRQSLMPIKRSCVKVIDQDYFLYNLVH